MKHLRTDSGWPNKPNKHLGYVRNEPDTILQNEL